MPAARFWIRSSALAELVLIALWTLFVTRAYADLDPRRTPRGGEFLSNIQTLHAWELARTCGLCGLWYGGVNGGFPAAAEPTTSALHPIAALPALIFGAVNGAKVALVASFFLAGLAQWLLGRVLGLRPIVRLWASGLAVAAGSLAAYMSLGDVSLVLGSAAAALVWPALLRLARTGDARDAVRLGAAGASLLLAGTGYMQAGTLFLGLAIVILLPPGRRAAILLRCAFAVALALLLAAPLLLPLLRFLPFIRKDFDSAFPSAQPLLEVAGSLVNADPTSFFAKGFHGFPGIPAYYALDVGWVPVLLAAWGLLGAKGDRARRRESLFLAALVVLALWLASAGPQRLLIGLRPPDPIAHAVAGLRYTGLMGGLAIPPLLGLAGLGLDRLLARPWPQPWRRLDTRWLLAIPLAAALVSAEHFGSGWISTETPPPEVAPVVEALRTPGLEWVCTPFGEGFWIETALENGLKLTYNAYFTWHWDRRYLPAPRLAATRGERPPGMPEDDAGVAERPAVHRIRIIEVAGAEYAAVMGADGRATPCRARGSGGDLDVACDTRGPGTLVVRENSYPGWRAAAGQGSLPLLPGDWLSVRIPAGSSEVRFRYRPWDVPVGLLLALIGLVLAARASRSPLFQRAAGEEHGRPDAEQGQLQPHVPAERAGKEREPGHDEAEKLQGPPGGAHRESA
jgi:hypothetical protein